MRYKSEPHKATDVNLDTQNTSARIKKLKKLFRYERKLCGSYINIMTILLAFQIDMCIDNDTLKAQDSSLM